MRSAGSTVTWRAGHTDDFEHLPQHCECIALLYLALFCLALPCLALPCLILPCLVLPYFVLPCFALFCLALFCLILPYFALPYFALRCLDLTVAHTAAKALISKFSSILSSFPSPSKPLFLSFTLQGISAKNVTLGVPRLNEILNVAKNIKTPSVTINIRKADDEEEASDLISQVRVD